MNTQNIALIFAGGTGQRMNSKSIPKQFLELHGKPIIIYTLEHFQKHSDIDGIIVVCLEAWIAHLQKLLQQYDMDKVMSIVSGGETGQLSIYNGLGEIEKLFKNGGDEVIVLIHDGVRPLINEKLITDNIKMVMEKGSAITTSAAIETVAIQKYHSINVINEIIDRSDCRVAKAPQSFFLNDILSAHRLALSEGENNIIDSASMMMKYGYELNMVDCEPINIKITTPIDFYMFKAILDARENAQLYGIE
ncbi:IspD/TarI family cytidylyltransferase [Wohlfahrtiimonas larvae]|uniref:IspD/TarI family cytidylyltransferase n=1 Tax=Wohlfahrtiimonas larvae TaxID=1157986 RepID=A0ABP9MGD0_9GAMM|nr:IspD/TarI family cytidylyltransferase [Wohlfahrtiimonas larvae]